jgi:hypothetical protein
MSEVRAKEELGIERLRNSVTFSIEMVGPEEASTFLEDNIYNRKLSNRNLSALTQAMGLNHWKFNGDPIRISKKGELLDGQHRLTAIISANVRLPFVIIRGLQEGVFDTIDTNQKRTATDVFNITGEKDPAGLAAALRFIDLIDNGYSTNHLSNMQIQELLHKHPDLRISVDFIRNFKASNKDKRHAFDALEIPKRTLCGYHYLFTQKDAVLADEFFRKLLTGESINSDEPVYLLRNLLIATRSPQRIMKYPARYVAAVICKAWNHTRQGTRTGKLMLGHSEEFPRIM